MAEPGIVLLVGFQHPDLIHVSLTKSPAETIMEHCQVPKSVSENIQAGEPPNSSPASSAESVLGYNTSSEAEEHGF